MTAPVRLLEDPRLAAELRVELQEMAASEVDYDSARGLAGLSAVLAGPAPSGDHVGSSLDPFGASPTEALEVGSHAAGAGGTAAASGLPVAIKLTLLAAVGGMIALGASFLGVEPSRRSDPSARPARPATALPPERSTRRRVPPCDGRRACRAAPPSQPPTLQGRAHAGPGWTGEARPGPSPSRREITQLNRIRALLERDPAAAHRLIRVAQREFPAGVLREEREGLDALALFELGQPERARRQAERFVARYPNSPLRARVERLLGSPANEVP